MITNCSIKEYFELEYEAQKASYEALMRLPVNDRVRKRKAIKDVIFDKLFCVGQSTGETLYRLKFKANHSDFKEGETVLLHPSDSKTGIQCTITKFEGEYALIISVSRCDIGGVSRLMDKSLVLDKTLVDLRGNVYHNFTQELALDDPVFARANSVPATRFANREECESELQANIRRKNLQLTDKQHEAIVNSMAAQDHYLIQGPPGTGKSFVLGIIMMEEIQYFRHHVLVIGPNHHAINNALVQAAKMMSGGNIYKVGQWYNAPAKVTTTHGEINITKYEYLPQQLRLSTSPWIIGLTPHALYTRRAYLLDCDTLIIDEAGQMTIPLTIMGMIRAKKVIFAGDHKQLPPIVASDKVSDDFKHSLFQRWYSPKNSTMLDVSFRMCEPICRFVSELFYEGRLNADTHSAGEKLSSSNPLLSYDHPIVVKHIDHRGTNVSDEEAQFIADTIAQFIAIGSCAKDIAVLAPFRAQAQAVRRYIQKHPNIPEAMKPLIAADTIDKMQGQERAVIFYSMTSGDYDYAAEMSEFLFNPNKMNVAFSRAKYKLIVVGNINCARRLDPKVFPHLKQICEKAE